MLILFFNGKWHCIIYNIIITMLTWIFLFMKYPTEEDTVYYDMKKITSIRATDRWKISIT